MLDKYKEKQFLFYKYITESFKNKKVSHAYLIETNNVSYGLDLAYDLAKFLLCDGYFDKKTINLIENNTYENFKMLKKDGVIKKEEVLNLQGDFSLKSTNGRRKVYLIEEASLLNESSANSLLKFLEEPEGEIVAILVTDNVNNVKNTIASRCQIISLLNNEGFDYRSFIKNITEDEAKIDDLYNDFLDFYVNLEEKKTLVLKDRDIYNYCEKFQSLLTFGLYLYFDLINGILESDKKPFLPSDEKKEIILKNNTFEELIRKVDIINKFIITSKYNVNKNLFLDNFVIKFGGESK